MGAARIPYSEGNHFSEKEKRKPGGKGKIAKSFTEVLKVE
jgi:hypothetical protein